MLILVMYMTMRLQCFVKHKLNKWKANREDSADSELSNLFVNLSHDTKK